MWALKKHSWIRIWLAEDDWSCRIWPRIGYRDAPLAKWWHASVRHYPNIIHVKGKGWPITPSRFRGWERGIALPIHNPCAKRGVGGQPHAPVPLPQGKICGTHCIGRRVGNHISIGLYNFLGGTDSSVGIATELRAGRSGIESRWGTDFLPVQTGPGAHPASCKMGTGSFPGVKCGRGVLLTTHPLLVPRSWKSIAIPLPSLWATPGL